MRVFDACALLAVHFSEPGGDRVAGLLEEGDAVVSAVNQGEVVTADRPWKALKGFRFIFIR